LFLTLKEWNASWLNWCFGTGFVCKQQACSEKHGLFQF
jgi:hypothetical protein